MEAMSSFPVFSRVGFYKGKGVGWARGGCKLAEALGLRDRLRINI